MATGKFQECIVLYFDIFAYSSKILEKFALSAKEICKYAKALDGIWKEVERIVQKDREDVAVYYFSDSCFILYPIESMKQGAKEAVLQDCMQSAESLYRIFLEKKLFIRGSISRGEVYYSANILFGPPIIRAVRFEGDCPAPMIIMPINEVKDILEKIGTAIPPMDIPSKDKTKILRVIPILPLDYNEYISMIIENRETNSAPEDGAKLKYWSDVLEILNKIKGSSDGIREKDKRYTW